MNFSNVMNKIKEAIIVSGYSRAAKELQALSDRQLEDIGFSRGLLEQGGSAYPWRIEDQAASQETPANLTTIDTSSTFDNSPVRPQTPKAA